jgi:hypothetical protein
VQILRLLVRREACICGDIVDELPLAPAAPGAVPMPESVRQLLPRLRDPQFPRVLLVTLPEATPVHEPARCQDGPCLGGAGIRSAAAPTASPFVSAP